MNFGGIVIFLCPFYLLRILKRLQTSRFKTDNTLNETEYNQIICSKRPFIFFKWTFLCFYWNFLFLINDVWFLTNLIFKERAIAINKEILKSILDSLYFIPNFLPCTLFNLLNCRNHCRMKNICVKYSRSLQTVNPKIMKLLWKDQINYEHTFVIKRLNK